jgi:cytochrome oxidase Cu insertion factor (SCO1/SenC/PrrC family)
MMSSDLLPRASRSEARAAVAALYFVLIVTALWWALALWPTPGAPPAWLARARWVCFNVGPSGLPDAAGFLLLVGQPAGLVVVLIAGWGGALREGLRELFAWRWGRAWIAACALCVGVGLSAAAVRVAQGSRFDAAGRLPLEAELPAANYPRLDRPAPELGLVDQRGEVLALAGLRGRPALVTFAFGHCETVCPSLVREVLSAQRAARELGAGPLRVPRIAVVTLDPWRDTPARLPALAQTWGLDGGEESFVLSGTVDDVNALLDRWQVPRARNETNGQLDHPALVYVLDAEGRIAYASTGRSAALAELVGRL